MDLSEILEKIRIECTNNNGVLLKDKFKVALIIELFELTKKNTLNDDHMAELQKNISKILGTGHSWISCAQFFKGENAIPHIEAFLKQNSLTDLNASSFWSELIKKLTIY